MNEKILNSTFEKIKSYIRQNEHEENTPVVNYKEPAQLRNILSPQITDDPVTENEFLQLVNNYLTYAVKTNNKQFFNQLYSGFNLPAFIGDMLTTLTNTSLYTYEAAPAASLIEAEMIKLMSSYAGYTHGDGTFLTGGSNGNLIAMLSARNNFLPQSRFQGYNQQEHLVAYVNEQSHYSFDTAANLLGIGSDNVIKVKAGKDGRMLPQELEREIEKTLSMGRKPFFVAATCSTTLLAAYDPIDEIADITQKYGLWLHADGAFGGSILLSDKYRDKMKGIERTDSFSWDAHKLMNIPLVCSVLLVKNKGVLQHNLTDINTDYIYHDLEDIEDPGKKSIQCGRHVDAVKLWFAWKYYGKQGYAKRIENLLDMSAYAEEIVKEHPRLELMAPRQSFNVCFRYVPEFETDLNEFNLALRENLRKSGQSMVNFGFIGKELTIRLVTSNGELTKTDIEQFFDNLLSTAHLFENQFAAEVYEYQK